MSSLDQLRGSVRWALHVAVFLFVLYPLLNILLLLESLYSWLQERDRDV